MTVRRVQQARVAAAVVLAAVLGLAYLSARAGIDWVSRPFPGFLLLGNRVVASVDLPGWPVPPEAFQATVVAIDGTPVATPAEVYANVASRPLGTRIAYTLEHRGDRFVRTFDSRLFTWRDAALLFGVYLFDGLAFAVIGIVVWMLSPRRAATWALQALGLCVGVYALTAIDLYGPHVLFRVHALAEAFLPAVLLHLGLVFPVRRLRARTAVLLSYLPCVPLAAVYQLRLTDPARYPDVHQLATLAMAASGLVVLVLVLVGYRRAPTDLVRHRVRVVALGFAAGFLLPVLVLGTSALADGRVSVNAIGYTGFLFPLSIAYAVHKRDLFAIDALVQRSLYYTTLSGLVTASYLLAAATATQVFHLSGLGQLPAFSLVFTLAAVFLLPALRDRLQRLVDLVFGRQPYDAEAELAAASTALGSTLNLTAILRVSVQFPLKVLELEHAAVFVRGTDGFEEGAREPVPTHFRRRQVAERAPMARLLAEAPQILVRGALPSQPPEERAATVALLEALGAALVVPLTCQGALTGFIVCGRKRAGTPFAANDARVLRTFANQAALSLQNARTFRDLRVLNRDLEVRVNERTGQLAASKERLAASRTELEAAYRTLQSSRERLASAEKMAAFGRLAADIAHEVNAPLGASLNGLKVARELVAECQAACADPAVPAEERRALFAELRTLVASVEEWTHKAVSYIRSVKAQGRTAGDAAGPVDVSRLLQADLAPLLMHRLRLAGGELELRVARDLPELHGDGSRLGQVIANLITNAIDACEGLPAERQRLVVEATGDGQEIVLAVHDRGAGIDPAVLDRIFEEFFTTKPPGKGTGLGLSIARDIVTGDFGGTLACTATGPEGTTFTIRLPVRSGGAAREPRTSWTGHAVQSAA